MLLDQTLNSQGPWKDVLKQNQRRVEVDLHEVERVLDIARRTPGLGDYEEGLQQLSVFLAFANRFYQDNDPDGLTGLVEFWERYRSVVIQRYTGITPVELRAADMVVSNIFDRFIQPVPNDKIAYSPDVHPLVFGGEGGLGGYFTHPPGWNRPFAIINLPHTAFDNVWQWLALPHETGHDLYASVVGLQDELRTALGSRMQQAVANGEVQIPSVTIDLQPFGIPYTNAYTGEEFLESLWRAWANEAQADIIGLLMCGGAATVGLQQIIRFSAQDGWEVYEENGALQDAPEEHPTSYVRNALNIAALRKIEGPGSTIAQELEQRFHALRPQVQHIVWKIGVLEVAKVSATELEKSAEIAADVLVNHQFAALGNKSYVQISSFASSDQSTIESLVDPLLDGDPTFSQEDGVEPRHALAATVLAFEKNRGKADVINRTFKHFVQPA